MPNELRFATVNLRAASDAEYAALNAFHNTLRAEQLPDDPPVPLELDRAIWQLAPELLVRQAWGLWQGETLAALAIADFTDTPENRHVLNVSLRVVPDWRRRGLARQLLHAVVEYAEPLGRRLFFLLAHDTVPAGAAFLERVGAECGLETHINQLALADLSTALLAEWLRRGAAASERFELLFWDGATPEPYLEELCRLIEIINTAPRGTLEVEDFRLTPEHIRQWEQAVEARGQVDWMAVVRERATGRFAGFTNVVWHPAQPWLVHQGGTGVYPDFRGNGLGQWLKAAMLDRLLRERPEARFVRTENADVNAAMLKINDALGFRPYVSECIWQVELSKVRAYLDQTA